MFQIVHDSDISEYSQDCVYGHIIDQLNKLATEGIAINVAGKIYNIFFKLALIIGDNLGLNTTLGFRKSFNCDYFCRFSKITKSESKYLCKEKKSLLRNRKLQYRYRGK